MATQRRRSTKGTRSKTHKGRKNYTTKKGDKVFHRKGKYVRKSRKPYSKKKRGGDQLTINPGIRSTPLTGNKGAITGTNLPSTIN